ncbi:MAG: pyrimidine dimer DNA glycosylase/endonuclease V [Candidatus Bipolaricaulota bacterium]|nr:hypothetical protein [Candidatus Bipolaricaulota bacterium]MBS3792048.1 hypothetical protein [Candidatus Bipolaricaulota bacterium]
MNIFVLDRDPEICARYHSDSHVVKMTLETAQLLCTGHRALGNEAPYSKTHVNHPCAKWTRESKENYKWLVSLGEELLKEYTYRYEKVHGSTQVIAWCRNYVPDLPEVGLTERPQAMDDKYRSSDPVEAYREYYRKEKRDISRWTGRSVPHWF